MAATIVGFSTHTPLGAPTAMQAVAANVMAMSSSVKQGTDAYSAQLTVAGGVTQTYLRIRDRNTDGINTGFNLDQVFGHVWFNFTDMPDQITTFLAVVNGLAIATFTSGVLAAMRTTGRLTFYDNAAIASGTANLTFTTVCTEGGWYRLDYMFKQSDGSWELKLHNSLGTLLESHDSVTDGATWDFGGANFNSVFCEWHNSFSGASTTPTFTVHYGGLLVASGDYPDPQARIGLQLASGAGTLTGWTVGAGTDTTAVHTIPPDGSTSYIVSTTADASAMYPLTSCASRGISGTILAFSPFYIGWDVGGAVTLLTRFIENSVTTDTGATDPGANVDFHLRGLRENTMPSDASAPTIAKLDAMTVGTVRDSGTVEVRVGTIGNHVVFVPVPSSGGGSGTASVVMPLMSPPDLSSIRRSVFPRR